MATDFNAIAWRMEAIDKIYATKEELANSETRVKDDIGDLKGSIGELKGNLSVIRWVVSVIGVGLAALNIALKLVE